MPGHAKATDEEILAVALAGIIEQYPNGITAGGLRRLVHERLGVGAGDARLAKVLETHWIGTIRNGITYYLPPDEANTSQLVEVINPKSKNKVSLPPTFGLRFDDYPQIPAGALIVGDFHSLLYDPEWLQRVTQIAKKHKMKRVVVNGDLFDFTHLAKFTAERYWTTEQELECARGIIEWLLLHFETVHVLPGNHDARISKKIDKEITTDYLLNSLLQSAKHPNLFVHWHHHAYVGQTWLVAHPKNFSSKPISPADHYIAKYKRNVAINHTHLWGIAEINGQWAVEVGMMSDPGKMAYVHKEINRHPNMSQGALIITDDEKPILLHPRL